MLWRLILGHGHPAVVEAVQKQLSEHGTTVLAHPTGWSWNWLKNWLLIFRGWKCSALPIQAWKPLSSCPSGEGLHGQNEDRQI